jgi:hypothetical protein
MATIGGETSVVITMKQIAAGIVALLVGGGAVLWAVLTFTIGGVRDDIGGLRTDVSAIRGDIGKLQESAAATPGKLSEAQLALSKDISGLRVDLETFRGDFKVVRLSLDDIGAKVDTLIKQQKPDKK